MQSVSEESFSAKDQRPPIDDGMTEFLKEPASCTSFCCTWRLSRRGTYSQPSGATWTNCFSVTGSTIFTCFFIDSSSFFSSWKLYFISTFNLSCGSSFSSTETSSNCGCKTLPVSYGCPLMEPCGGKCKFTESFTEGSIWLF